MDSSSPPPSSPQPQRPAQTGGTPGSSKTFRIQAAASPARRHPKPPPLLKRFVLLCLRPESWAEAARYPTIVTLLPLLLAILLSAGLMASSDTSRLVASMTHFAEQYDSRGYPPLELHSDGTLSSRGALPAPIRMELPNPLLTEQDAVLLVDPTAVTSPESIKTRGYFISDKEIFVLTDAGPTSIGKLATWLPLMGISLPPAGETKLINTESMTRFINNRRAGVVANAIPSMIVYFFVEAAWSALMVLLITPLIIIVAGGLPADAEAAKRRLILPRRAAVRMVMGLLVPIILVDAISRSTGHGLAQAVGSELALGIWFLACGALAVWTGILAQRMYGPKVQPRRAQ